METNTQIGFTDISPTYTRNTWERIEGIKWYVKWLPKTCKHCKRLFTEQIEEFNSQREAYNFIMDLDFNDYEYYSSPYWSKVDETIN